MDYFLFAELNVWSLSELSFKGVTAINHEIRLLILLSVITDTTVTLTPLEQLMDNR